MNNVRFFTEDIDFKTRNKTRIKRWICDSITDHHKKVSSINYIFGSDKYVLEINKKYLDHDSYTDIITFDNSARKDYIEADIFISIERVEENANAMQIPFDDELHRVMIHGVLHLIGYNDKTDAEKEEMRKKENHYLALRF